uniref:Uncharacterized protein n=1 Tax=Knipowitschia caucasica TaxID=637954 RepID=A0AAV2MCJ7_KNICA
MSDPDGAAGLRGAAFPPLALPPSLYYHGEAEYTPQAIREPAQPKEREDEGGSERDGEEQPSRTEPHICSTALSTPQHSRGAWLKREALSVICLFTLSGLQSQRPQQPGRARSQRRGTVCLLRQLQYGRSTSLMRSHVEEPGAGSRWHKSLQ